MTKPIGIFDSGVGGLSVLRAVETLLPNEDILYFADTAHFPYGKKTKAEILRLATQATAFLFTQNVKLILIASHAASLALPNLQKAFPIPILGMIEPTTNLLKQATQKGPIAILGPKPVLRSKIYQKVFPQIPSFSIPSLQLVEKIEQADNDTQSLIQKLISPLLGQSVETLLLACTHLPLIKSALEEELDPCTTLLNPALSAAKSVQSTLKEPQNSDHKPQHTFYISGDTTPFQHFLAKNPLQSRYEIRPGPF